MLNIMDRLKMVHIITARSTIACVIAPSSGLLSLYDPVLAFYVEATRGRQREIFGSLVS